MLLTALLVGLPATTATAAGTQQATLDVKGMVCPGCEATVEAVLGDLEGVASVRADRSSETAAVVYDPAVTTPATMVQAVNADTYYQASLTQPATDPGADADAAAGPAGGRPSDPPLPPVATGLAVLAVGAAGWLVWRVGRARQRPSPSRQP